MRLTLVVAFVVARSAVGYGQMEDPCFTVCLTQEPSTSDRETGTDSANCTSSLAVMGSLLFLSILIICALLAIATLQTLRLKSARRSGAVPMTRRASFERRVRECACNFSHMHTNCKCRYIEMPATYIISYIMSVYVVHIGRLQAHVCTVHTLWEMKALYCIHLSYYKSHGITF